MDGKFTAPGTATVTLAVVSGMFGSQLAWIVVVPAETPVTVTPTLVSFAGKVTVAGTEATAGLSDERLTVRLLDSAVPRSNAMFCVLFGLTTTLVGR